MAVKHVEFEQQNYTFNCPPNLADCDPLHVYRYQASKESYFVNVSTWELDDESIADIVKTRRIYLYVFNTGGHSPVSMSTSSPFVF